MLFKPVLWKCIKMPLACNHSNRNGWGEKHLGPEKHYFLTRSKEHCYKMMFNKRKKEPLLFINDNVINLKNVILVYC